MTPSSPLSPPAKKIKMEKSGKGEKQQVIKIRVLKQGCIFSQKSFPSSHSLNIISPQMLGFAQSGHFNVFFSLFFWEGGGIK